MLYRNNTTRTINNSKVIIAIVVVVSTRSDRLAFVFVWQTNNEWVFASVRQLRNQIQIISCMPFYSCYGWGAGVRCRRRRRRCEGEVFGCCFCCRCLGFKVCTSREKSVKTLRIHTIVCGKKRKSTAVWTVKYSSALGELGVVLLGRIVTFSYVGVLMVIVYTCKKWTNEVAMRTWTLHGQRLLTVIMQSRQDHSLSGSYAHARPKCPAQNWTGVLVLLLFW